MNVAKFKKTIEDEKIVISYLPVFGWTTGSDLRKEAMVPGPEDTVYAGSIYPVTSQFMIEQYGQISKILPDYEVQADVIQEEERNSETGEIDSYYLYTSFSNLIEGITEWAD